MKFPSHLIENLIAGMDRAALARAASAVSDRYRARGENLSLKNETEALAYAAARMPATYAAIERILADIDFRPRSILDFGAGPGTAALAAKTRWPDAAITMVEPNRFMRGVAAKITPESYFSGASEKSDLVIAAYVLNETPDPPAQALDLWNAAQNCLVLIDSGTPEAAAMMLNVRDHLIKAGAYIHGPCPHHLACPFTKGGGGWCHFSVRLERTKLHKALKGGNLGYEDEKFTYLIAGRQAHAVPGARMVGHPRSGKVIEAALCRPDGTLEQARIAKSDPRYRLAKKLRWGDVLA